MDQIDKSTVPADLAQTPAFSANLPVVHVSPMIVEPPILFIPEEAAPVPVRRSGVLIWLLAMILLLAVVSYLAPRVAEEIQYSLTRGRQRAEYELAGDALSGAPLSEISRASQMVTRRISPSVVIINVSAGSPTAPVALEEDLLRRFGPHSPPPEAQGQGSGVVVDAAGYVLTNFHVINNAKEIRVTLSDGRRMTATLVGVDRLTDLALLKLDATNLTPATWGDSDAIEVGSLIWAVGSPFGLERSVSFGILSAKNRGGIAGTAHQDFLQTDAAVNPGNSGGPLVDAHGMVVGINTAIVGPTYSGVSFAIPSNVARQVAERLKEGGYVSRGWLGVQLATLTDEDAAALGLASSHGALITYVVEDGRNSPAAMAGIKAGDVVVRFNGTEVTSAANLSQLVAGTKIGAAVNVDVIRDGRPQTISVTVAERPRDQS
jgi:S1-C subfamily serine protease